MGGMTIQPVRKRNYMFRRLAIMDSQNMDPQNMDNLPPWIFDLWFCFFCKIRAPKRRFP
jgi:hypothetical protein